MRWRSYNYQKQRHWIPVYHLDPRSSLGQASGMTKEGYWYEFFAVEKITVRAEG